MMLNYYANLLDIKIISITPTEKVFLLVQCKFMHVNRERLIAWYDPLDIAGHKLSQKTELLKIRIQHLYSFCLLPESHQPSGSINYEFIPGMGGNNYYDDDYGPLLDDFF